MSPEHLRGHWNEIGRPATFPVLGTILYLMLTGQLPSWVPVGVSWHKYSTSNRYLRACEPGGLHGDGIHLPEVPGETGS